MKTNALITISIYNDNGSAVFYDERLTKPTEELSVLHEQKVNCEILVNRKGLVLKLKDKFAVTIQNMNGLGDDIYFGFKYAENICYVRWNKFRNKKDIKHLKSSPSSLSSSRIRYTFKWINVLYRKYEDYPAHLGNFEYYRHHHLINFLKCIIFTKQIACNKIARAILRCLSDPNYKICRKRLHREFNQLLPTR